MWIDALLGRTRMRLKRHSSSSSDTKGGKARGSPRQSSLLLRRMLRWKVGCNNLLQSSSATLYCLYNKRKSGWDLRLTQGALLEPPKQLLTYITEGHRRLKWSKDLTCLGTPPEWRAPFTSLSIKCFMSANPHINVCSVVTLFIIYHDSLKTAITWETDAVTWHIEAWQPVSSPGISCVVTD